MAINNKLKICHKCKKIKDIGLFSLNKGAPDGRKARCKKCLAEDYKEYKIRKNSGNFIPKTLHGSRPNRKLNIETIKRKIFDIHGDTIKIVEESYINILEKCKFIDKDYGEWFASPNKIINCKQGHPKRKFEKFKNTCLKKFGARSPLESAEILEKIKETNIEKYGVDIAFNNPKIQQKAQKTIKERYGVSSVLKLEQIQEKIKQTNLERYGSKYPCQNIEIALKISRSQNNTYFLIHWKTGESVVCQASYEKKVIEYFNANKIDYIWQSKVFTMPPDNNGKIKTYRPDCYLPDLDIWIEIKGYFREKNKIKWEWFHKEYRNSELWNKEKLKQMGIL